MKELRGMPVVKAMTAKLSEDVKDLAGQGITPTLAIVRVGARPDDLSYERGATKRFTSVGAAVKVLELPETCTQEELEATVRGANEDAGVHGILIFRPLPKHLSEEPLKALIAPEKDVDCFGNAGYANLFIGAKDAYPPCTPQAVVELIDHYGIDLTGKKVTIVGRSLVVGKPLMVMLLAKNATVKVCHTRTRDLAAECRDAEIVVAAAGVARMLKADFVAPGQTVIDVGINMDGDTLCGDVDAEAVSGIVDALTPVPGGIGTITTAVLLKHTVMSARRSVQ